VTCALTAKKLINNIAIPARRLLKSKSPRQARRDSNRDDSVRNVLLLDSPAERLDGVSPAANLSDVIGRSAAADRCRIQMRWAVAKLVRHQALDLAFEGSNPSRPAKLKRET
jgi:hypothetical protein